MNPNIALRPVDSKDDEFLFQLFRSAHEYKFVPLGLPEEQLVQLLRAQFQAQELQYRGRYSDADLDIVMADGVPIGRFYVWRGPDEINVIDVTITPGHRGNGIGGELMRQVLCEGRREGKPVRAHVEKMNRARKLWARLGFQVVEDTGIYLRLEQPVETGAATPEHQTSVAARAREAICD